MNRRATVVAACLVVVATAGCLGVLTGSQPLTFAANETVVGETALTETGYQSANGTSLEQSLTVGVAGQEREVRITSYLHVYNRSVAASELVGTASTANRSAGTATGGITTPSTTAATQFAVLATPGATVGGRNVNPLASLPTEQLVARYLAVDRSGDLTFRGNRTVRSLGAERTVSTYRAEASGANGTAVTFHEATFERNGDVIVVVAGHPATLDERDRVDRLLRGLTETDG